MTNTTRPFHFLHTAAERLNSCRATAADLALLAGGYIIIGSRDHYVPNPAMVTR